MAGHRTIVGGVVAAAAWAALAGPAAEADTVVNERLVLDGCEVGGGGNDIHSLQSHYEPERDRIAVTLRLCGPARREATYRVHLDHAAPFVGRAAAATPAALDRAAPFAGRAATPAATSCATTADSAVARAPGGHRGVGTSEVRGNEIRFVVPLARLRVGTPEDVPRIPLWATSTLGKVEDRAPNRETGDGCAHPRATTETLVQARVAITGGLAFILSRSFTGAIASTPGQAVALTDRLCQLDAKSAGFTKTGGIHAWLSNEASTPVSYITPLSPEPIQTADGTQVAQSISAFGGCTPSGNPCLQAPIDKDVHGNDILDIVDNATDDDPFVWTGTYPDGDNGGGALPNCQDWTSDSASDTGTGGNMIETNAGFTTGGQDSCDRSHHVMCVQFE
jgi:hypothetical protein